MHRRARGLVIVILSVLSVGCVAEREIVFPEGLGPLEENTVPELEADAAESITFASGDDDGTLWVHGRGLVHASLAEVFSALQTPAVVQDRRGVDEWVAEMDVEQGYDASFAILNTTREIIVVEWTVTWREVVVEGTLEEPEVVAIRYQKTDGSPLLDVMEGSIIARVVGENRTEVSLIEHLKAPRTTEDDLLCYQQDLFDEVVLTTRGEALPQYTESCR